MEDLILEYSESIINMIVHSYTMRKENQAINAIRLVLGSKKYFIAFFAIAAFAFLAYSYLLFGSTLNLALPKVFGFSIYLIFVSMMIGVLLSLTIVMNVFAFANGAVKGGKTGLGAALIALVPGSLCCTSVIPALLAAFGASTATIIRITGTIQGPFAAYETGFIALSIGLLFLSVYLASKSILRCNGRRK
jgi:hypothetical protein